MNASAKALGKLILRYRGANSISQKEFGKLFNPSISHVSIGRWEKGQMPKEKHFARIAEILELSPSKLSLLIDNPKENADKVLIEKTLLTPNKKHLNIFLKGTKAWNRWREKNPDIVPQLSGLELHGYFSSPHWTKLKNANCPQSKSRRLEVNEINLSGANLRGARLNLVDFSKSNFENANLQKAVLDAVKIEDSSLRHATFEQADIQNCELTDSNLKGVNFDRAIICRVGFQDSRLCDSV